MIVSDGVVWDIGSLSSGMFVYIYSRCNNSHHDCRSSITTVGGVWEWLRDNVLSFVCLLLTFLSLMVVGLLFLYHTYLMLTGQTTWEQASRSNITYFKDLQELYNPFNEGCCCNLFNFLCGNCSRDREKLYFAATTNR